VIVLGCVLESALDVQPLSPTFEAFLSDSINLDIISGKSLPKSRECGREVGNKYGIAHEVPAVGRSSEFQAVILCVCGR